MASLRDRGDNERYFIRAVERALTLLEMFLPHAGELNATEISRQMDLDPSTTFRMLVTLQAHGFVEQNPATGKYRLGVTCLELGSRFLKNNDVRERALAYLELLRNEFGEAVHLTVLDGNEVVYLEKLPGLHPIGFMSSRVGGRSPAYCTGVGKALLAFLPEQELEKRFAHTRLTRYTETTITNWEALKTHLAQIRANGFAMDHQEHELGVECVAVPIFNHKGLAAAMSVSGPVERMDEHIAKGGLIQKMKQMGSEISTQLGWGRGAAQLDEVRSEATASLSKAGLPKQARGDGSGRRKKR